MTATHVRHVKIIVDNQCTIFCYTS